MQNFMGNTKLFRSIVISVCILMCASACAQNIESFNHFGNNGKKFTHVSKMSAQDWDNPEELDRVWRASIVRIPSEKGRYIQTTIDEISLDTLKANQKYPTVIYLHGCSGIWAGTLRRINFLAKNGFAVIAPPSFAREKYPRSCDVYLHKGGLYRDTLKMRQQDAGHAIEKAKRLSWVDGKNVFLMGLSEGGITTATFKSKKKTKIVNARVVEGWTCNSTWREYKGINAPKSEPVLTLLGSKDPWFQNSYTNGECTNFLNKRNGSKSIVFTEGALSYKHELLEDDEVKKIVLDFLHEHSK